MESVKREYPRAYLAGTEGLAAQNLSLEGGVHVQGLHQDLEIRRLDGLLSDVFFFVCITRTMMIITVLSLEIR